MQKVIFITCFEAGQHLSGNRMGGMVSSLSIEKTHVQPLVPWFRVIFKYLVRSKYQKIRNVHYFRLLTSYLMSSPSEPPFTLSLPCTKDA